MGSRKKKAPESVAEAPAVAKVEYPKAIYSRDKDGNVHSEKAHTKAHHDEIVQRDPSVKWAEHPNDA